MTPGTLGCRDAADPGFGLHLGDTPGSLGINDHADPFAVAPYGLGFGDLHLTLSLDRELIYWDYDPNDFLKDGRLNPEFVQQAHRTLRAAVGLGFRPKVHQAYRSPEESDALYKKYKAGTGGRATPAWQSVHNYGLAMDVWLYDSKGGVIDNHTHVKDWYKLFKQFAKTASVFLWGEPFGDADHFEYHPGWKKPAKGAYLLSVRDWAMKAAIEEGKTLKYDALATEAMQGKPPAMKDFVAEGDIQWQPYFWWAAGAASDLSPSSALLKNNPPPVQG